MIELIILFIIFKINNLNFLILIFTSFFYSIKKTIDIDISYKNKKITNYSNL